MHFVFLQEENLLPFYFVIYRRCWIRTGKPLSLRSVHSSTATVVVVETETFRMTWAFSTNSQNLQEVGVGFFNWVIFQLLCSQSRDVSHQSTFQNFITFYTESGIVLQYVAHWCFMDCWGSCPGFKSGTHKIRLAIVDSVSEKVRLMARFVLRIVIDGLIVTSYSVTYTGPFIPQFAGIFSVGR